MRYVTLNKDSPARHPSFFQYAPPCNFTLFWSQFEKYSNLIKTTESMVIFDILFKKIDFDAYHIFVKLQWSEIEYIEWAKRVIPKFWMSKTRDSLNLKLGWMKFCNDMNQKRCASKNLLTRNFTKPQKSENAKSRYRPWWFGQVFSTQITRGCISKIVK